jgi:hypothetical protein
VNIGGEGHRVTEGEHDRGRRALQRGSYDGWCQRGRPGDETNADSLAARRFELLIDPLGVAVPTADEAEPASAADRRRESTSAHKCHRRRDDRVTDAKRVCQSVRQGGHSPTVARRSQAPLRGVPMRY